MTLIRFRQPLRRIGRRGGRWLRATVGWPATQPAEILYRLNRAKARRGPAGGGTWRFSWGDFAYGSLGSLVAQYREIFVERHYRFEPGAHPPVIVDCGGNAGLSVVWFKQEYPESEVHVYEADPAMAALLRQNVGRLGLRGVHVHEAAAWTSEGEVGFLQRSADTGTVDPANTHKVRAVALADVLPPHVDLLKLDVEGGEFSLLAHLAERGAIERISRLVAELHLKRAQGPALERILRDLRQHGMEVVLGHGALSTAAGRAAADVPFEIIADRMTLVQLYAWRAE